MRLPPAVEAVAEAVAADQAPREHDAFLSHASPDKPTARQLHEALEELGLDVWFDEKNLELGRSQARAIDEGIANAHVGIVLLTPAFLQGRIWTDRELGALLSANRRIIPVLSGVTFEQLRSYSPIINDLRGLSLDELGVAKVAELIAEALAR